VQAFTSRNGGKSRKVSIRIAVNQVTIRARYLPNKSLEHYSYVSSCYHHHHHHHRHRHRHRHPCWEHQ